MFGLCKIINNTYDYKNYKQTFDDFSCTRNRAKLANKKLKPNTDKSPTQNVTTSVSAVSTLLTGLRGRG